MSPNGGRIPAPLIHRREGTAVFDVGAAYAGAAQDARERALLAEELGRHGIVLPGSPAPGGVPPRALVHPPSMPDMAVDEVRAGLVGMGDIHTQESDPGERYWENHDMPRAPKGDRAIARKRTFPRPPGMTEDQARFYEEYLVRVLDRVMQMHEKRQKCGTYFVQPQPHLSPPPSAIPIDVFTTAAGVPLVAAAGLARTIVQVNFPDRFIGVINRFGFLVEDHIDFASITLSMQRNQAPLRTYGNFNMQFGTPERPAELASPLFFGSNEQFRVIGTTLVDTTVFMRAQGWAWPTKNESADGSLKILHTS